MTTKRREVIALDYVKRFYAGFSHSISGFFSSEINVCNGSPVACLQFTTWTAANECIPAPRPGRSRVTQIGQKRPS